LLAILVFGLTGYAEELRGVIIRADSDKHELVLEGRSKGIRGATLTIQIDPETQILVGRKPATLADLPVGKRVRVVCELRSGKRVASLISMIGPLSIPSPPSPPPAPIPAAPGGDTISGVLRRVAPTDREIVVISPGTGGADVETTVLVPDDAKIARGDKAITFDDLQEGEPVVVYPQKRDGKLVAAAVQAGTSAGRPVAPAAPDGKQRIERFRNLLKMLDGLLEQLEKR
jgi:hypothetical protein